MKKLVFVIATIIACGTMIACVSGENRAAEAPKPATITVIEEPLVAPASVVKEQLVDRTMELKVQSYEAIKGYMEADFYNDNDFFDIVAFCKAVGCKCVLSSTLDEIIVEPIGYNDKETFQVAIKISPAAQMVNGDVIRLGKIDGNSWEDIEYHFSATDFTTGLVIDDYNVQIGFDELDYLWREIRLLTAPEDKFDEINAEIDAEIQSYYDIDIDHLNG